MLEDHPIPSVAGDVNFDTSDIPLYAWVKRFHLPEVCVCVCVCTSSLPSQPTSLTCRVHVWLLFCMCDCVYFEVGGHVA